MIPGGISLMRENKPWTQKTQLETKQELTWFIVEMYVMDRTRRWQLGEYTHMVQIVEQGACKVYGRYTLQHGSPPWSSSSIRQSWSRRLHRRWRSCLVEGRRRSAQLCCLWVSEGVWGCLPKLIWIGLLKPGQSETWPGSDRCYIIIPKLRLDDGVEDY